MRRDEVESLTLFRLGYGGYRLPGLARVVMRFEGSLTAAMVSALRRARFVDGEWVDTCKLKLTSESADAGIQ
jgi:hypothetical protein